MKWLVIKPEDRNSVFGTVLWSERNGFNKLFSVFLNYNVTHKPPSTIPDRQIKINTYTQRDRDRERETERNSFKERFLLLFIIFTKIPSKLRS